MELSTAVPKDIYTYTYLLFYMRPNLNLDPQIPQTLEKFKGGTALIVVVIRMPMAMN